MADIVHLTLTGRQRTEEGEETLTEITTESECYTRAGSLYLLYQEPLDQNGSAAKCCIKLKDSVLEITKNGAVRTRMVFQEGKEYLTDYVTPYGRLKMGIRTKKMELMREDERLDIRIEYSLTAQGEPFSHCIMEIMAHPLSKST